VNHTPTPWTVNGHCVIHKDPEHLVADCCDDLMSKSGERAQADAEFIVKAVNNHDLMVELLRRLVKARDHYAEHGVYPPEFGLGPGGYDCYDDWAADMAETLLKQLEK